MLLGCFPLSFLCPLLSSNMSYLVLYWLKCTDGDWHSVTGTELQDTALRVIIHTRLGRPIPCATADLGCPVLIPSADHFDIQSGRGIWPRGLPDLVRSFFKLNGGGCANTVRETRASQQSTEDSDSHKKTTCYDKREFSTVNDTKAKWITVMNFNQYLPLSNAWEKIYLWFCRSYFS